jgi:hypothetical protein
MMHFMYKWRKKPVYFLWVRNFVVKHDRFCQHRLGTNTKEISSKQTRFFTGAAGMIGSVRLGFASFIAENLGYVFCRQPWHFLVMALVGSAHPSASGSIQVRQPSLLCIQRFCVS